MGKLSYKQTDAEYFEIYKNTISADWFTVAADFESINKATEREKFLSDIAANQKIVKDIEHITLHITGEEKDKMKKGGIFSWLGSIFS